MKYAISLGLFFVLLGFIPSCQDNCINYQDFTVIALEIGVNDQNKGILSTSIPNTEDTIRSTSNQFISNPAQVYSENHIFRQQMSFVNAAYAQKKCPDIDRSFTFFDPDEVSLTIDEPYDASFVGGELLPEGTNLMADPILVQAFLKSILSKGELLQGFPTPFGTNKDFFKPINKRVITFNFVFVDEKNEKFESSFSAYIDFEF